VAQLIYTIYIALTLLILARVLMSWVQVDPYSPLARTIYNLTEPILAPVRNLLPPMSGLDFSPLVVLIGIQIIGNILIQLLG
jgi:YggT family protein